MAAVKGIVGKLRRLPAPAVIAEQSTKWVLVVVPVFQIFFHSKEQLLFVGKNNLVHEVELMI